VPVRKITNQCLSHVPMTEPAIADSYNRLTGRGYDKTETADLNEQELGSANVDDEDNRLTKDENERDESVHDERQDEASQSSTTPEVNKKRGEKRNNEEAAQAARERYLARKRMKQSIQ